MQWFNLFELELELASCSSIPCPQPADLLFLFRSIILPSPPSTLRDLRTCYAIILRDVDEQAHSVLVVVKSIVAVQFIF
jgi:hypothetical protein